MEILPDIFKNPLYCKYTRKALMDNAAGCLLVPMLPQKRGGTQCDNAKKKICAYCLQLGDLSV